jgi:lycopene cyclase-like protein
MKRIRCEILVIGVGPSGLAMAVASARCGADVVCVGPNFERPWPQNYGAWLDEVRRCKAEDVIEHTWPRVRVALGDKGEVRIERAYCRLDTMALQRKLLRQAGAASVVLHDGIVTEVVDGAESTTVTCQNSQTTFVAQVVVDCSGARTSFTRRRDAPLGFQVAYGQLVEFPDGHGMDPEAMTLMDFSLSFADARPTFLYAMPLTKNRVFLEETSLVGTPALPMEMVCDRLRLRRESLGLTGGQVLEEERCVIPMGLGRPFSDQRIVPFGGAASMIHPATGYLVARVLADAESVAECLVAGLHDGGPAAASRAGHDSVWSPSRRRTWMLYDWGMRVLRDMNEQEIRIFFHGFFHVEDDLWMNYLQATGGPGDAAKLMWGVFCNVPWSLRWKLMTHRKTK